MKKIFINVHFAFLLAGWLALTTATSAQERQHQRGQGLMGQGQQRDTQTIHTLLDEHQQITKPTTPEANMKVLKLQTEIGEGNDKQVDLLFEGQKRKIQQLTLRNRAVLAAHKAAEPITIQCIAGNGVIRIGEKGETVELRPGVLLTLEPNVTHEVEALPAVSILLTRFTEK